MIHIMLFHPHHRIVATQWETSNSFWHWGDTEEDYDNYDDDNNTILDVCLMFLGILHSVCLAFTQASSSHTLSCLASARWIMGYDFCYEVLDCV